MSARRKREWFDNDSFWRDLYPFMFPEKRFADAALEVDKAITLAAPKGKSVLDLCCGPGRCSVALANRGFAVTGVDKTAYLLDKAKARARAAKVKIEWVQADMRDFVRPESFDFVLSMFTSFGYFDNKQEDVTVLKNILASLRPSGKCLIDVIGKERLAKIYQPTNADVETDGTILVQRREAFDDWTRMRNEWILIRKGRAKSFRFHHTIYSGQELRDQMAGAGFVDVRLYGNLDGDEYGPNAQRLIAIGRKPEIHKKTRRTKASSQRLKGRG
jgi:SAM-dependent methyltransferase